MKKLILAFLCTGLINTVQAADLVSRKNLAKIAGITLTTGILYELALRATYAQASPEVAKFTQEIMAREGLSKNTGVLIDHLNAAKLYASSRRIFINRFFHDSLLGILKYNRKSISYTCQIDEKSPVQHITISGDEYLTLMRGLLTHEAAHLRNHDGIQESLATVAIIIGLGALGLQINSAIGSFCDKTKHPISYYAMNIATGLALFDTGYMIHKKICRLQEQRADDAVTDPSEIKAWIAYLRPLDDRPPKDPFGYYQHTYISLHQQHPRSYERVARFEQRLQEIETISCAYAS